MHHSLFSHQSFISHSLRKHSIIIHQSSCIKHRIHASQFCFLHCFSRRDANPLRVFSPLPQPSYHPQGGRIDIYIYTLLVCCCFSVPYLRHPFFCAMTYCCAPLAPDIPTTRVASLGLTGPARMNPPAPNGLEDALEKAARIEPHQPLVEPY